MGERGIAFGSSFSLCMAGAECVSDESRALPLYSNIGLTGQCWTPNINLGHSLQQANTSLTVLNTHAYISALYSTRKLDGKI